MRFGAADRRGHVDLDEQVGMQDNGHRVLRLLVQVANAENGSVSLPAAVPPTSISGP